MGQGNHTPWYLGLWDMLKKNMAYRTAPGCTTCLGPIVDENGTPVVAHCSQDGAGREEMEGNWKNLEKI